MAKLSRRLSHYSTVILIIFVSSVSGNCPPSFSGPDCKRQNIAHGLRNFKNIGGILRASSSNNYPAQVFDGDINNHFSTFPQQNPYLWVNLGTNHTVYNMTLYIPGNQDNELVGFKIEVDYTSEFVNPRLCYQDSGNRTAENNITCNQTLHGQYVRVQVPSTKDANRSLVIQEFEIYRFCPTPFSGPHCKRKNVAFVSPNNGRDDTVVYGSKMYNPSFHPAMAFDGNPLSYFLTYNITQPYLWVNLSTSQTIHIMTLYALGNFASDLKGFKIEVANTSDFSNSKLCYQDTSTKAKTVHPITCEQPLHGQFVRIQIPTTSSLRRILGIQEFEIYQCEDGYYGSECANECGECRENEACDKINGQCNNGCKPGWQGSLCVQECDDYTYGDECGKPCGNCKEDEVCDKMNGSCPQGCKHSFIGKRCDVCMGGVFGVNCTNGCGRCLNQTICDKLNGTCALGCEPGFKEPLCVECLQNRYGDDCLDECVSGYGEDTCQTNRLTTGNVTVGAVGGVMGCLLVIVVIVVVVVVKRRKRRDCGKNNRGVIDEHPFNDIVQENGNEDPPVVCDVELGSDAVYANSGYVPQSVTRISIAKLTDYLSQNMAKELPFDGEFKKLPQEHTKSTDEASKKHNAVKCRYRKLVPYDETRVVLDIIGEDENTDFINASYIDGYSRKQAYIASQGTTEFNIVDFWRMIWQEQVGKIVMLTKLTESGKEKVLQYWPDSGMMEFGDMLVETIDAKQHTDYCFRILRVKKESHVRDIQQFQFLGWPDHDVPHDTPGLIDFRDKVNSSTCKLNGPLVIHCSAGVGRTGTYITFDYIMDLLEHETELDIFQTVVNLRNQRPSMVQTREQYLFIYRLIRDAYLCQSTIIGADEIARFKLDSPAFKERLKLEFESLCSMCHLVEAKNDAWDRGGMKRVWFSSGGSNYIDITTLPIDRENFNMISTKVPAKNEILNFWRMVNEYEHFCLVLLERDLETANFVPKVKRPLTIGSVEVSCVRDEMISDFLKLSILSLTVSNASREISVFYFTGWTGGIGILPSPSQLVEVKNQISHWERKTNHGTIVVVCSDGIERSGLCGVSDFLIDNLKVEQNVNMLLAAKRFRGCCPSSIKKLEQYQFCYQVLQAYIDAQSTYANLGLDTR